MTTANTPDQLASVPHPAGATRVFEWGDDDKPIGAPSAGGPNASRYFTSTSWVVNRDDRDADICLQVDGIQHADGGVERHVVLDDDELTVDQARQLAAALIAAADVVVWRGVRRRLRARLSGRCTVGMFFAGCWGRVRRRRPPC